MRSVSYSYEEFLLYRDRLENVDEEIKFKLKKKVLDPLTEYKTLGIVKSILISHSVSLTS